MAAGRSLTKTNCNISCALRRPLFATEVVHLLCCDVVARESAQCRTETHCQLLNQLLVVRTALLVAVSAYNDSTLDHETHANSFVCMHMINKLTGSQHTIQHIGS